MTEAVQAIRGMNDILPAETPLWQYLEQQIRELLVGYGYSELRFPIVEKTELFKRSIGEVTDIVEKEMYTFDDRNGDSLTLRPEGTAGCVRAAIENGLLYNQTQRLWYMGAMFRHERPQKGRTRQFHQVGVEAFGLEGPDIDAELISMGARLWKQLDISDVVTLQLNSLGSSQCRAAYRQQLVAYLRDHYKELDEDSKRRLEGNPLRILDSKNRDMEPLLSKAPKLMDHLDGVSRDHFQQLCEMLDGVGIEYQVNPRLVRGLDYYSRTVFEWVTDQLGAQGTICAGGRFDALVEQLGGRPVAAAGFAMGMERLASLLTTEPLALQQYRPQAYLVRTGEGAELSALQLAEQLRDNIPAIRLKVHTGGGSFKAQFRQADKSGAAIALVLGEREVSNGEVTVKHLRDDTEQITLPRDDLPSYLKSYLAR